MARFKVGIIGCGRPYMSEGATGSGQAHAHARGYEALPDCEVVAAADIRRENLQAFCREHGVPRGYATYQEMLAKEQLDIVSICLWPALHAQAVIDAARAGVRAVHCEKPMAPTWGEARKMAAVCAERGVQLTFHHQRRTGRLFRTARDLLDSGAVGELERVEAYAPNLYDWGIHWFDMMFFYNHDEPVEWVMGQVDARGARPVFGVTVEGQGMGLCKWRSGTFGMLLTGHDLCRQEGARVLTGKSMACANRLVGREGTIEVGVVDGPQLRFRGASTGGRWQEVDTGDTIHGKDHHVWAIAEVVDALKAGRESTLSARRALQATELIFATYESSRRRGRVDLPLEIEDSPLLSMLEAGTISTEG